MTAIEKFTDSFQPLINNIVSLFEANSKSILDFEPIKANILERNKGASGKLKLTTDDVNFFMQQTIDLQGHIQTFGEYFTANQGRLAEVYNALKELDDVLKSNNERITELTQQNSGLQESLTSKDAELANASVNLDQIKAKAFAASSDLDAQAEQKLKDKATIEGLQGKNDQFTAQIANLRGQNKTLVGKSKDVEAKSTVLTTTNQELTQEREQLRREIETSQALKLQETEKNKTLETTYGAQIASLTLKNKNLEEIADKNKLLTERNDKLTQDQTNLLEQIERKKEFVKKYEEERAICEEERARLKTLSESIGTYIDGVDDHLTGQSARQGHIVDTGAFRFTAKSPELPAYKQGSPDGGGKRRKRTLRKKIIRRR